MAQQPAGQPPGIQADPVYPVMAMSPNIRQGGALRGMALLARVAGNRLYNKLTCAPVHSPVCCALSPASERVSAAYNEGRCLFGTSTRCVLCPAPSACSSSLKR